MNLKNDSTGAAGGARRHLIDVICDINRELICLRAMAGFGSLAAEDALAFNDTPRNTAREGDIIIALAEIEKRIGTTEAMIAAVLADDTQRKAA